MSLDDFDFFNLFFYLTFITNYIVTAISLNLKFKIALTLTLRGIVEVLVHLMRDSVQKKELVLLTYCAQCHQILQITFCAKRL